MRITHQTRLPIDVVDALSRLSPNKRQISGKALALTQDKSLDNLISHLDGDARINQLLLDPEIRGQILLEGAGPGFKSVEYTPSQRTGQGLNQGRLVRDRAINYGGIEQDLIDLYSLKRELDYEKSGQVVSRDNTNNPIYNSIRNALMSLTPGSVRGAAQGGIRDIDHLQYGKRQHHPLLPVLDQDTALNSTTSLLIDNLLGNQRGEQPSGKLMKGGKMSGIPVEHLLDFNKHPQLGYDPSNRMLGSTSKNSIRQDSSRIDSYIRLNGAIAQKEKEIFDKYGANASSLGKMINYQYQPLKRMAGESGVISVSPEMFSNMNVKNIDKLQSQGVVVGNIVNK